MFNTILSGRLPGLVLALAVVAAAGLNPAPSAAADSDLVGMLSLALEEDVAVQLTLSDQQKKDLGTLIASRQADGQKLAAEIQDQPASERTKQLAPFREESESKGLSLLSAEQQAKLKQIWIRRRGFASLSDGEIAKQLGLTPEQASQIDLALSLRAALLDQAEPEAAVVIRAVTDKKLASLLTPEQRAKWEAIVTDAEPAKTAEQPEAAVVEAPAPAEPETREMPPAPTDAATDVVKPDASAAKHAEAEVPASPEEPPVDKTPESPPAEKIAETAATDEPSESPAATAPDTAPAVAAESPTVAAPAEPAEAMPPEPSPPGEPGMAVATDVPAELPPAAKPDAMVQPLDVPQQEPAEPEVVVSDQPPPAEAVPPAEQLESPEMAAEAEKPTEQPAEEPIKLRFNFRYQPWADVLDWFASQAGLSLVLDSPPPGTFNYVDARDYTPAEAIDLLNKILMIKGYVLVRSDRMLVLFNLEDGIPPNLVTTIPAEELDSRGEYELVAVLFQLKKISPEEAQQEISELLGPQGSVVVLPKSQQIKVTDTAGRLRTIRSVIQAIEDPDGLVSGQLQVFEVRNVTPEEVLIMARQLLDIPADQNATADGSLRFAVMPFGTRIMATGKPEMLTRLKSIIDTIDVPDPMGIGGSGVDQAVQLEIYPIHTADPQSVLKVMQTLLAGIPDVRLELEAKTNALIALARPAEHATIRATLNQMESDAPQTEVIQLHVLDPQLAVLSINKMLGTSDKENTTKGLTIDADPNSRQLIVRGTSGQIAQVRDLLEKLGETEDAKAAMTGSDNVRVYSMSSRTAQTVLEQLQQVWPTMRPNKIRQVTPSTMVPAVRLKHLNDREDEEARDWPYPWLDESSEHPPAATPPPGPAKPQAKPDAASPQAPQSQSNKSAPDEEKSAQREMPGGARVFFAAQTEPSPPAPSTPAKPEASKGEPPEIIVSIGPGGLVVASEDTEALDAFEHLVNTLSSGSFSTTPELTVFYLKHAKAAATAETLDAILGGGTLVGGSSGGEGDLAQDMADAALGDLGGGILGSLMGFGGGAGSISPTGSIKITPETRLNALIVQANAVDLETIRQLLEILDQMESPEEILAVPKPRLVPVYNTQASEVAQIVQQMYQDRLVTSGGSSGRQPSPQEFLEALRSRGRGGSSRGGRSGSEQEVQKMTIGVDTLSNSVIVSAPEPLFQEVKSLIETLDQVAVESNQTMQTVRLHQTNPQTVQQALSALVGSSVQFSRSSGRSSPTASQPSSGGDRRESSDRSAEDMQRRMEFFRALRERMGSGGGPPGSFGGTPGGFGGFRPPGSSSGSSGRSSFGGRGGR